MSKALKLHPQRLFSSCPQQREIATGLYEAVKNLPIISPHGHTDPRWFADNDAFDNPAALLIQPDHYLLRMLYSQGVDLNQLGVKSQDDAAVEADPQQVWQRFADHYKLFLGTPTRLWMDHVLAEVFGVDQRLDSATAIDIYQHIDARLKTPDFRPRALFERFNIEVIATTESPLDPLASHQKSAG